MDIFDLDESYIFTNNIFSVLIASRWKTLYAQKPYLLTEPFFVTYLENDFLISEALADITYASIIVSTVLYICCRDKAVYKS